MCRAKAYYVVQHMFLTEAVLTLLLYKTLAGYCTSTASQVRVTESIQVRNSMYLYKNFFVCFITVEKLTFVRKPYFCVQGLCLWEMLTCKKVLLLYTMLTFVVNSYFCKKILLLYTILTFVRCFLSPFCFNGFVKLIAFCPWYVIQ